MIEIFEKSKIPCVQCGKEVQEFSVPNNVWNSVVRPNGHETNNEYLCVWCFLDKLVSAYSRLLTTDAPEMTVGDSSPINEQNLSEPCPICKGRKKEYAWFKWINCPGCGGKGRVTPARKKELTPSPTPSFR